MKTGVKHLTQPDDKQSVKHTASFIMLTGFSSNHWPGTGQT